jgi:hypothetical protein
LSGGPHHPNVRLEPDAIAGSRVAAWLIAALVVMLALTGWAGAIFAARRPSPPSAPAPVAPLEISGVNQWLFETRPPQQDRERDQRRRLSSFGWVDRAHGVVHLPIEDAFDLILREPAR